MPAREPAYAPADVEEGLDDSDASGADGAAGCGLRGTNKLLAAIAVLGVIGVAAMAMKSNSIPELSESQGNSWWPGKSVAHDAPRLVDAAFLVWTFEASSCKNAGNRFRHLHSDKLHYMNVIEATAPGEAGMHKCGAIAAFGEPLLGAGLCSEAKATMDATRCGVYAAPVIQTGNTLRSTFPGPAFMNSMAERKKEGHIVSLSFLKAATSEQKKYLLKKAGEVLSKHRSQPGNVVSEVLQGTKHTSSEEFVWFEEWKNSEDHGELGSHDEVEETISGPLVDLGPIPSNGATQRGQPWSHVGGLR